MNLTITGLKVDAGGGEGSRGGKVIGHTSSGKPIYLNPKHAAHGDFTKQEHTEAANTHAARNTWKELHGELDPNKASKEQIKQNIKVGNAQQRAIEFHSWRSSSHILGGGDIQAIERTAKQVKTSASKKMK